LRHLGESIDDERAERPPVQSRAARGFGLIRAHWRGTFSRMDETRFWQIVETTAPGADSTLGVQLGELSDEDLRGFASELLRVQRRAYRWDLWAAAYLALGGCSDDAFEDFRTWLIRHGHVVFERVLEDPDSLVELSWDEDEEDFGEAESWGYQVYEEWDRRHDQPLHLAGELDHEEPAGDPFPEDDEAYNLQHFPRLSARYL
jgi:hypothetical protein